MKLTHLNAYVQQEGYPDLATYLNKNYIEKPGTLEAIADDLDISVCKLRSALEFLGIKKPKKPIPLTLADAKRMGPDDIARAHHVSRATAWRWKRFILRRDADGVAVEATDVPDAGAK